MTDKSIQDQMRSEIADKGLFEQAKASAFSYMDDVAARRVYPDTQAIRDLDRFEEPLPEGPQPGSEILNRLHSYGAPATVAQTGGRYFGFVNGGIIPTALAARWISDTWDQNPALYVISPIVSKLEQVVESWLRELLGLPAETVAGYLGGSSLATFSGLAAARYHILTRLGWDVNSRGLFGAPEVRVVVSEQAHGAVFKALALLGLGKDRIERVPADAQGRIIAAAIPQLDSRTILVLQAGNVNTGAFDAFEEICMEATRAKAWVHVDGAFGLWAAASNGRRYLTRGIERADSWALDAHKTLNSPYDCGIVLCRHPDSLVAAMQARGDYIHYSEQRDGMLFVPDMSRRARAVELWATLRYLGKSGAEQLVDGLCERATQFAEGLSHEGFRVLNDVVFNQVLVACGTPARTQATLAQIQDGGVCWCGGTVWAGEPAIRVSVSSWATTAEDVDLCVGEFVKARAATGREHK
ncbi:MAG: pyridoxal-dependent decarboxylase [Spirochaetia bacterium]